MRMFCESSLDFPSECLYLPERTSRFEYFYAAELNEQEFNSYLEKGWRKFGQYYFRPHCALNCFRCVPIRVLAKEFCPTKSQKKVIKKASNIKVKFCPLKYRDEIFEIIKDHSLNRFGRIEDKESNMTSFFTESCPSFQSEYYLDGKLIAVGFLDQSNEALSSVYFVFDTSFGKYSLGTLGAIREIQHAASLNLKYYYLGYYIKENHSMAYKNRFHPNEKYNWEEKTWNREEL